MYTPKSDIIERPEKVKNIYWNSNGMHKVMAIMMKEQKFIKEERDAN